MLLSFLIDERITIFDQHSSEFRLLPVHLCHRLLHPLFHVDFHRTFVNFLQALHQREDPDPGLQAALAAEEVLLSLGQVQVLLNLGS